MTSSARWPRLRLSLVGATGVETAGWLYLTVGGLKDVLPFARGYGAFAALLATIAFVTFVLPAILLTAFGKGLQVASWLASVAAILYLYDPLLRACAVLGAVPFVSIAFIGAVAAASAAMWHLANRHSAAPDRQQ